MWNKFLFALSTLAMTLAGSAAAVTISATIEKSQFRNTTPTNVDHAQIPAGSPNIFTVGLGFEVNYNITDRLTSEGIKQFWIRAPGEREFTLKASVSGQTYKAKVSAKYIGGNISDPHRRGYLLMDNLVGCLKISPSNDKIFNGPFMWRINDQSNPQGCVARDANKAQMYLNKKLKNLVMAFQVDAPEFLRSAPPGTYQGSVRYRAGRDADYDFGEANIGGSGNWQTFDLNFEFLVASEFHVVPLETSVTLLPPGGWGRQTDVMPNSLQHTMNLTVASNNPVALSLRCQEIDSNGNCLISNQNDPNITVPLEIELTLPSSGGTCQLRHNEKCDVHFIGKPAPLKLSVDHRSIEQMAQHRGVPYSGNVTLIFDAN